MAIKNKSRKPFIEDNDKNIFIGVDLPVRKSNGKQGYFASTSTTIAAVKNNIRNLLSTHQGERLFQPTLGVNLRQYLFEQIDEDTKLTIQNNIIDTFSFWLPFVEIKKIQVDTTDINFNSLVVSIIFNIKQDPNTIDSVQVQIGDTGGPITRTGIEAGLQEPLHGEQ